MKHVALAAFRLVRSPQAQGIAKFVAPTNPIGRIGAAVAITAALAGVQLGLVAGHTGLNICQLGGVECSPQHIAGGAVLHGPSSGTAAPRTVSARRPKTPSPSSVVVAQGPPLIQTVVLSTQQPAQPSDLHGHSAKISKVAKVAKAKAKDPGSSAVPELRRAAARAHAAKKSGRVKHERGGKS